MNESTAVIASSLAITEKRPRKTGGCVGIFFQLFDWNRRFTKKKLFSKKFLPAARTKQASKQFGGDEKLPKLRLIADDNGECSPNVNKIGGSVGKCEGHNGVQTPNLVARLMGLESMPSVHQDALNRDSSVKFGGDDGEFEKGNTRHEFRPQKLQKTGMMERRPATRFGPEVLQLKSVLSRPRKHHHPKLASPVKNPRDHSGRNTSRLIGAATRILEPGFQSRSKARYALNYTQNAHKTDNFDVLESSNYHKNTVNLLNRQSSCKTHGNLLDVVEARSYVEDCPSIFNSVNDFPQKPPRNNSRYTSSFLDQKHEQECATDRIPIGCGGRVEWHSTCRRSSQTFASHLHFKETKDFVAMNKNLSGRTRMRIAAKVEDIKFDKWSKFDGRHDCCSSPGLKRRSINVSSPVKKSMMVNNIASTGKQLKSNGNFVNHTSIERKSSHQGESNRIGGSVNKKSNEIMQLPKPFLLTGDTLGAIIEEKLKELMSRVEKSSENNSTQPKRTTANIFQELICALDMERPIPHHHGHIAKQNTSLCFQAKQTMAEPSVGYTHSSDHLSPGSVLEASFSNDSCCSSSLEDGTGHMLHEDTTSYSYDKSQSQSLDAEFNIYNSGVMLSKEKTNRRWVIDLLNYISEVLHSIDHLNTRLKVNELIHAKEVIFNAELVLRNSNEIKIFSISNFLLNELETLSSIMCISFSNFLDSKDTNRVKGFVFDFLIEYLDLRYGRYSKCGFRSWRNLLPLMNSEVLINEVMEEVKMCVGSVELSLDELIERDMSQRLGKWTDFEIEGFETAAEIDLEILQSLVDDIILELTA